jgi:tetratricopeptide (TPR) repeat protein
MAGQKDFHRLFACVSPVFVLLALTLLGSALFPPNALATNSPKDRNANADLPNGTRRSAASAQFAKAEEQRAALNNKPSEKRMLADYKQAVATYRHVALITPRAPEVPDSLVALGELYTEMGDRFGRNYYQFAVDSYQFLVREYPTSRYTQEAVLRTAKLQRDQLNEPALAMKTYADFLKRFPRSQRKREAQEAMAELALLQNGESAGGSGSEKIAAEKGVAGNSAATKNTPRRRSRLRLRMMRERRGGLRLPGGSFWRRSRADAETIRDCGGFARARAVMPRG